MTEEPLVLATPMPKVDPESLAIRARPRRAIRFKRGVIIAIAAIGSVILIAITWSLPEPFVLVERPAQPTGTRPRRFNPMAVDAVFRLPTRRPALHGQREFALRQSNNCLAPRRPARTIRPVEEPVNVTNCRPTPRRWL